MMLFGALLVALGILGLLAQSGLIRYKSDKEVPHDSQSHLTVKEDKVASIPPLVAGLTLAAGAGLMIVAARK